MTAVLARELELDNFKSFGRKTIIPFRPGFTTIFGPNGSGKSNIVDSLLFCLGLSTSKTMRAERLPDLLNNTSGRREARVALRLELCETREVLEVARVLRLTKAGYTSTYYLDGHPVTLAEVHHRLAELNISPKGNNVVMQGDVTRILTMTALERRRIIDEMAGVAEFDARIEDAKAELEKAVRHMSDTQILLGEIKGRVDALATERDNAVRYKELREQKLTFERLVSYLELAARKKQLEGLERQIQTRIQERAELEGKRAEVDLRIHELSEKMALLQQEIRAKGEEQRVAKLIRMEEIKGELSRHEDKRAHLQSIATEKMNRARDLERDAAEAKKTLAARSEQAEDLERQLARLDEQAAKLKAELKKLHDRISRINQDQADNLQELGRLRGDLQEKKLAEMELRSYRNGLQATLEENQRTMQEQQALLVEFETKLHSIDELRTDGEQTREALAAELDKSVNRADLLRRELLAKRSAQQENERALRAAYKAYHEVEARSQAAEGTSARVMKALIDAGIRGIRGTVGELARIPADYSAAIEAAAGRRLDFIVVEDENVGAECIQLLKKAGAGRMTFLPMTKMRADTSLPHFSNPGFLGYAIELIEFDPEYGNIFAYVLGRTVIARSMQQALPFMNRMRIVTLDGDLLEMSGAMTGGKSRGGDRERIGREQVEMHRRKVTELERRTEQLERETSGIEEKLAGIASYQEDTRRSLDKLDVEMKRDREEAERLTLQVGAARKKCADLTEKSKSLTAEIDASQSELERIAGELLVQEERLATMDRSMAGLAMRDSAARAGELETGIRAAEDESLRLKESLRGVELEMEYLAKNLAAWQEELETSEAEIEAIRRQIEQTREASERLFAEQEQMSGEIEELSESVRELKAERDALSGARDRLKQERDGIESRLFRVEGIISQQSREFDTLAEEVERLAAIEAQLPPVLVPEGESLASIQQKIGKLTREMESMEPVNMLAIDQYDELAQRHSELQQRLEALTAEKDELLFRMDQIGQQKLATFMSAFDGINEHFQALYAKLSAGHGKLVLENQEDPFAGGLIIHAQPKDKKMERMDAMSGGEKSLTALAFVFAIQSFEPAPFYVFDEVDSFLDGPNTERLAAMVRDHARGTQFIVVSHKATMLEHSERTIGVYQPRNSFTQVKGIELDDYEAARPSNVTRLPLPAEHTEPGGAHGSSAEDLTRGTDPLV